MAGIEAAPRQGVTFANGSKISPVIFHDAGIQIPSGTPILQKPNRFVSERLGFESVQNRARWDRQAAAPSVYHSRPPALRTGMDRPTALR
jgi:hypothetical protein